MYLLDKINFILFGKIFYGGMGSLHNADGGPRQKHNAERGHKVKKFKNHCPKESGKLQVIC